MSGDFSQLIDSESVIFILNADTHPSVFRPFNLVREFEKTLRSFCQDLELVPVCPTDDAKDLTNELQGDLLMEEIAHGVDKDHLWLLP